MNHELILKIYWWLSDFQMLLCCLKSKKADTASSSSLECYQVPSIHIQFVSWSLPLLLSVTLLRLQNLVIIPQTNLLMTVSLVKPLKCHTYRIIISGERYEIIIIPTSSLELAIKCFPTKHAHFKSILLVSPPWEINLQKRLSCTGDNLIFQLMVLLGE